MGSKIGSDARKAKRSLRNRPANRALYGRAVVVLTAGLAVLGLLAVWFLGGPGRSTGRGDSELAPRPGLEPGAASAAGADVTGAQRQGREASTKSTSLADRPRNPADDPRFRGATGELRGHVEVTGDAPFPRSWTLVLRPSTTLYGRELAEERTLEFEAAEQDFTVRDLPLAGYDVLARASGMNAIPLPILIDSRNHSPFVNLRMAPAGYITGRVLDASGLPADGFPITLLFENEDTTETVTDALGNYRFDHVLDGTYELVVGKPTSPIVAKKKTLRFQAPSMVMPDIELPPLGKLMLTLVDENRRPLPDVEVVGSGNQGGVFEGQTDAYGYFEVRYLPAGRIRVRLESEGYASKRVTIELAEGELEEITLQMLRES